MPRKAPATSPAPAADAAAVPAPQRKRRTKAQINAKQAVAVWIGPSLKPKHWFGSMDDAVAFLSGPGLKRKEGDEIFVAELKPVVLRFTVAIGEHNGAAVQQ